MSSLKEKAFKLGRKAFITHVNDTKLASKRYETTIWVQRDIDELLGDAQKVIDHLNKNLDEISKDKATMAKNFNKIQKEFYELKQLRQKLQSPEFLETLAELEHEQWTGFIQYLISFAPIHGETNAKEFWRKYDSLSKTPYQELTEKQKESDRKFAREVLEKFEELLKEEKAIRLYNYVESRASGGSLIV